MKKIFIATAFLCLSFIACKKETTNIIAPAMEMIDTTAQLKYIGSFSNGPYGSPNGFAKIYAQSNAYTLVLDSFSVNNGPDLHVYLSKEIQPINFIDFGKLKATSGTQVYTINGIPDFAEYKYALIHCQQFNHLFGSALLQ